MTFPQSTLYGHLGVKSSPQFAAMAAANFTAQTVLVDDGSTLISGPVRLAQNDSLRVTWTVTAANLTVMPDEPLRP